MRVQIDGLPEALADERRLREEIYLDGCHWLCGIPLRQITPFLLARLFYVRTPFIGGGEVDRAAIGQFLWALHRDYCSPKWSWRGRNAQRNAFLRSLRKADRWAELEDGIDAFLDATFLDAPYGGDVNQTPYVCSIAWIEYRMACEPFRWPSERTMHTPLRRLYQLMRCYALENGGILYNRKSDAVKDSWLRQNQPTEVN